MPTHPRSPLWEGSTNYFVRIREWSKYQHYKNRNPPWIKLHRELLSSQTWVSLDDASRVLAIASMMLAALNDNKTPYDLTYIRRVAYLNSEPDFAPLLRTGFVEIIDVSDNVLADASILHTNARPETERETEEEKKRSSARKARGTLPNSAQLSKATGETRHSRIHKMIMAAYQEQNGVECPWNAAEGSQLKRFLDSTPHWTDQQIAQCLMNLFVSEGYPKSTSPKEFLVYLPKYLKGPLNQFKQSENGNGSGKQEPSASAKRIMHNAAAFSATIAARNMPIRNGDVPLQNTNGAAGNRILVEGASTVQRGRTPGSGEPPV